MKNIDTKTVDDFGSEWSQFSQTNLSEEELHRSFDTYFSLVDWREISGVSQCFDMGCGSGRWAQLVAPRVGALHCVDASDRALEVAKRNLSHLDNCSFHCASVDDLPFEDNSMDFGYSLGVLHHIPDTYAGIQSCVSKIKPGGMFLAYIYYAFDNKPLWFKLVWRVSNVIRFMISRLPFKLKMIITTAIAIFVYYPLSRMASILEAFSIDVENMPLSFYRNKSFYSLRTDALDRFGTRLEKRYTKKEIVDMFEAAGLRSVEVSEKMPYWCVMGYKAR